MTTNDLKKLMVEEPIKINPINNQPPFTIYNITNFRKLCKWINDNDFELSNIGEDIDHLKDQPKLTKDQGEHLKELTERYVQFDRCYQIAQDFSAWDNPTKKEKTDE